MIREKLTSNICTDPKNIAWVLPRPQKGYRGRMPLHCEKKLILLAKRLLSKSNIQLLNLFCGKNKYGYRIDLKKEVKPDLVADAHNFSHLLNGKRFDVILADPPYSSSESKELYNTPPIHYKKWVGECDKVLKEGGILIVYHRLMLPNPNPNKYHIVKRVFIGEGTNHQLRLASFYLKRIRNKAYLYKFR